jgi:hypothetical protein
VAAAQRRVLLLPHALRQMLRPDRMIGGLEVRQVIAHGEVIEEYPEDPRGRADEVHPLSGPNAAGHNAFAR